MYNVTFLDDFFSTKKFASHEIEFNRKLVDDAASCTLECLNLIKEERVVTRGGGGGVSEEHLKLLQAST